MQVVINSIIERLDEELKVIEVLRVLWLDSSQDEAVVMNISNLRKLSYPYFIKCQELLYEIDEGMSRLTELEVDMRIVSPNEEYLKKYKDNRDRRWNLIKDIVNQEPNIYISKSREKLVIRQR